MDIQLHFIEKGSGFPLILLHGNSEDASYFSSQIEYFSAFYRVIAIDTRGHGQSARGQAPFTINQFAEDLKAFFDAAHILSAHILGFSDGGNIALTFALRYPTYVRTLILNGANLYPRGMTLPTQLAVYTGWLFSTAAGIFSKKYAQRREYIALMAHQPHIRKKSLVALEMPSFVIAGTHDMIRRRHTAAIARSIPNCRLTFLNGSHFIARTASHAFNEAVYSFLLQQDTNP